MGQERIDDLSIDVKGQRLFLAALGNNSLEVIDLRGNKRVQTINGPAVPQGIAYIPSTNRAFVANGKDGSVRALDAGSWKMLKSIFYGDDAGCADRCAAETDASCTVSTTMKYGNAYMTEKRKAHGAVVRMVLPVRDTEDAEDLGNSA